jgi:hypothetical protein
MSVPSGMMMMMKSMGVDPDKIMEVFSGAQAAVNARIDDVMASQARIEMKLDLLLVDRGIELPQKGHINGSGNSIGSGSTVSQ